VQKLDAWTIYRIPFTLALISIVGLILALIGDSLWDWTAWVLLGLPLAIAAFYLVRPRPRA
jgi:xanthosine utilization system XapX-like protein